jgi:hypothetical protein
MRLNDWLPKREESFADLCRKWVLSLGNEAAVMEFKWDDDERTTTLVALTEYLADLSAFKSVDSTANRTTKIKAREKAMTAMRSFARSFIRFNTAMTDTEKEEMGVRPRDFSLSRFGRPDVRPKIEVEHTSNGFEHRIRAVNRETDKLTKPDGVYGIKYVWQVGGTKPESADDLPKSAFSRRGTHIVTFSHGDQGKVVYYACRYENAKGEGGPWSQIVEVFIA